MTSLWRNVSVNVVANSNWSLLISAAAKFVEECNRLLPEWAADSTRYNARVSQQHLHENCPQMIETEQRSPKRSLNLNGRYRIWKATREAILKPSSKAQNSFWIKSRTGEDIGRVAVDMDIHGYIHGYIHGFINVWISDLAIPWIYPWIFLFILIRMTDITILE